jgi:hypothetical protein
MEFAVFRDDNKEAGEREAMARGKNVAVAWFREFCMTRKMIGKG